ncbi:SidA/IucD/PvdA family monooxygenase [Streptomyces sp. ISID311]|uniref:SidA/IucD/PvdA family monooxygenase n=1 Tax=Streptomyces sp. ISID311 TaxID=2601673 RepID=UPI0011BD354E|nr:SidA/IucD/PvdA family monooxygenase [Streptomyces sp. ISID311]TXC99756.1 lysine N(6)-hydroxylase/L-ornithine N(5)-oxygenase family protein [Streptomyces sp. ISID311]
MFFERRPRVQWHPGRLFEGARMQISFLKDLVSPRNPASPYSILQYTKARGRLERFVNLGEFRPTCLEYSDYLEWAAGDFADQFRYDSTVTRVTPVDPLGEGEPSLFQVEVSSGSTGERTVHYARNVVHAGGGRPRYPKGVPVGAAGLLHSGEFLQRFPATFADHDSPYVFAVIGGGQSAGEVVAYVLERYENAQVHMVMSGYAPRPTDNSPFVNEHAPRGCSSDTSTGPTRTVGGSRPLNPHIASRQDVRTAARRRCHARFADTACLPCHHARPRPSPSGG